VSRDGNVQSRFLQLPDDSQLQALRFLSLCADPLADLASLNRESRRLYDLLVAPLDSDIQGAAALWIETDGILDRIPFDLLQGRMIAISRNRFVIFVFAGFSLRIQCETGDPIVLQPGSYRCRVGGARRVPAAPAGCPGRGQRCCLMFSGGKSPLGLTGKSH